MIFILLLFMFFLTFHQNHGQRSVSFPKFLVEIREKHTNENCTGVLIGMKSVLVCNCEIFKKPVIDLEKIIMTLDGKKREAIKIKANIEKYEEDGKTPPLHVVTSDRPFSGLVQPITINGGDLIETCRVNVAAKFAHSRVDENIFLFRKINPLPYEACKREIPEMIFHKKELCVLDDVNDEEYIMKTGSPLLCDQYLTGVKLYAKTIRGNLTVHVYIRLAQFLNWLSAEEGDDNPNWVLLESDYEEKMVIGNEISLKFKNKGDPFLTSWMLSAPALLFHYFNKFLNSSLV